jgi:predicted nucleic acid-binding protein
MAKLSHNAVILDTDVITNWLIQEIETATGKELWKAPHKIVSLVEEQKIKGLTCLTSLLEIRYLLRRKKEYAEEQIEEDINKITSIFEVGIPDEISLLKANTLQAENFLDPFDTILLAYANTLESTCLISRDNNFLKVAKRFISATTPEEFYLLNR